ncbi:MAG TPA: DUF4242 domain-containing protein [Rhodanobacteraceae bacterium]|nr:DUF4242 domain-containing protein [Rhodanobacteraceae bacterium]
MPMYVIEREIPGIGNISDEQARQTILASLDVLDELGEEIRWVQSYVVEDKVYCIYFAPDESLIRRHAEKMGIPANRISEVRRMLDPHAGTAASCMG